MQNRPLQRWAELPLLWFAALWPFEGLTYVPVLQIDLAYLAAFALFGLLVFDLRADGRLRLPFEFLWPVAVAALLWGYAALRGDTVSNDTALAALLFVTTAHFARSEKAIDAAVCLSAAGAGMCGVLTWLHWRTGSYPFAVDLATGYSLPFGYSVASGAFTLFMGGVLGVTYAIFSTSPSAARTLAGFAAIAAGSALAPGAVQYFAHFFSRPGWTLPELSYSAIAVLILLVWVMIRALVKVRLQPNERHRRFDAVPIIALIATLAWLFLAPVPIRIHSGFLLGLCAGYALPERVDRPVDARTWFAIPAVLAVALLNAVVVFEGRPRDPREYDALAREAFGAGDFQEVQRRMALVEWYEPRESRAALWRARAYLSQQRADAAAQYYAAAIGRSAEPGQLLLPPSIDALYAELIEFRDYLAGPDADSSSFAYERALLAAGETDSAMVLLEQRVAPVDYDVDGLPVQVFAAAVAAFLQAPRIESKLELWRASDLMSILVEARAGVGLPPNVIPPAHLPLVLCVERSPDAWTVHAYSPANALAQEQLFERVPPWDNGQNGTIASDGPDELRWGRPAFRADQSTLIGLYLGRRNSAAVRLRENGDMNIEMETVSRDELPYRPALHVWLPTRP
jgi:hypothetical protein